MGWSKLVIVPSHVIGRHMIEDFNVLPRSIRRIPRSVDLDKFDNSKKGGYNNTGCTITMIGRITPLKGHTFFLESMAKVIRNVPGAKIQWSSENCQAKKLCRSFRLSAAATLRCCPRPVQPLLENKRVFLLKEELGTKPAFFYFF